MTTTNPDLAIGPIVWVLDPLGVDSLIEACRTSSEVNVDFETTGLDEHATHGGRSNGGVAARISLASFTLPQEDENGYWDGRQPVTYVLPLSHPDGPFSGTWRRTLGRVLREGVYETKRRINNQNMKFDARWAYATTGIDLHKQIVWDPMVGSHLLDETLSTKLKEAAPRAFPGLQRWDDFDLSTPGASERVPLIELGEYAARDTYWNWRLSQWQKQEMFMRGGGYPEPIMDPAPPEGADEYLTARLGNVARWVAMPTVASLTRMEMNGFRLDIPWTRDRLQQELARKEAGLDRMAAKYGMPRDRASSHSTALWFKDFTQRAVDDGSLRIVSMTKNGNAQWNKGVLAKLSRQGFETADMIKDARGGQKLSEFLTSWLDFVAPDERVYTNYNIGRVATGRLSSNSPNMQQITKVLRPAFIPSDGYYLADFDFSQLELRVAAFIARCQPMIDAFNAGLDLHKLLGQKIVSDRNRKQNRRAHEVARWLSLDDYSRELEETAGTLIRPNDVELSFFAEWQDLPNTIPLDDVSALDRQGAKSANFGLLYLQSAFGFRNYAETVYGVVLSDLEAVEFHRAFFEQWVGMHEWHERVKQQVRRDGYTVSPIGRVRRLPNIWAGDRYLQEEAERQAVNTVVQGLGSDLMQIAAADIQGLMPGTTPVPGVRLVATVHDSVVAELPIDSWQEASAEIVARMERSAKWLLKMNVDFDVPIKADVTVGTRWSWSDVSDPEGWAAEQAKKAVAA